ncbi:NAD(P)H-quinone oxidoreductase [Chitinimonas koreensis]|nr:NAD(P)H-quinone oxidoreductase [Chitinimonas koreensis]
MRAVLQDGPGDAATLRLGETATPRPGPNELLVRVHAAGVNRADLVQREGRYPPPPGASPLLGLEVSGEVAALGDDVAGFLVGEPVFGLVAGGGYADYALLDAGCAIRKPAGLSHAEAASLPEAWMTAWLNLVELAALAPGETALVHAGASGVGAAAIQLAGLCGARAIATAGGEAKAAFCRALGAVAAVDYRTQDFAEAVRAEGGADVILDPVGGDYLERNVASLKPDGRLVLIGLMGGAAGRLDLGRLLVKRLSLRGSTLRPQPAAVKARLSDALREQVLPALLRGEIRTTLDRCFPFEQVADAHRHLEANLNLGKVVLTLDPAAMEQP